MALVSIEFCIFLFSIILIYLIVPQFLKKYVIVFANIFFGICNGVRSFIGLVVLCVFTFSDGLLIAKAKNKKAALIGGISVILIAFVFQRYAKEDLWIMVGLSFWGLQLISYLCDIYNKKYIPTHNFVDFFIYVSFFGNVTSGPIERADKILPQYNSLATNSKNIQHGIQLCLWGLMQKLILGERLAMVANTIFDNYVMYSGIEIIIGSFAYSLQIYCDFCGYSNIAVGVAEVFGLHIIENFKQPYFARTISEFWRRWHISLSQWLRDYIYIPLGGNKKSAVRKYLNIIIVFMISGIWHGNNATFIYWGGVYALYQIVGGSTRKIRQKLRSICRINETVHSFAIGQMLCTFLFVSFAWIFFRADSVTEACKIIERMIKGFDLSVSLGHIRVARMYWHMAIGKNLIVNNHTLLADCGLKMCDITIIWGGLLILFMVDILHYRSFKIREWIDKQNLIFRWIVYMAAYLLVIVIGVYGDGFDASSFIYSNF